MAFTKLLVPIAPEQQITQAFHEAFVFANQCSANVTLLVVIKELAEFKQNYNVSGSALDILDNATQYYQQSLDEHAQTLKKQYPKVTFTTKVRVGIPYIEIIKEAHDSQVSMVIIDSHRKGKEEACQRGSDTLNLMRNSEIPIWAISTDSKPIKNVVVALDLTNQEYQAFNSKLIALSIDFCASIKAELVFCHAWRLEYEGFLRDWSGYKDIEVALLSQNMRQERTQRLTDLLAPHKKSEVPIRVELLEGEARDVLPKYVNENGVDLVILGSMSRTGIAGFVMGNTAESMLNTLNCSVLTLKPDTFESPVLKEEP
ncbi:universal stress protein [Vibrio japonicus]|uniref:Universal stress protein n=1 Tax=Vibrio japonicus TaxID=1824638 RepID=A0ABY5LKA9_9VIBR|nr:universal stress protein [Vibrio japonicus]UUM32507.1 universal stress protein [Vibrio japonicus]